jgi:DTW domain
MATNNDEDEEASNVSLDGEASSEAAAATAAIDNSSTTIAPAANQTQNEQRVASYILETSAVQFQQLEKNSWSRVQCPSCNASRYLYCPDCCIILIPQNDWPTCIAPHGTLRLPFELDIILDDKRICASGVQVVTILRASANAAAAAAAAAAARRGGAEEMSTNDDNGWCCCCRLFDQALNDGIPNYQQEEAGTYFLFPDPTSVPLSSVMSATTACPLRKLVVLDCKWTSSSIRLHPHLTHLQKVHLDNPPEMSYFWRWHSAGKGMLSTAEAIYYAAAQVAAAACSETSTNWNTQDQEELVHLLWLFGLQRQVISRRFVENKDKSCSSSCSTSLSSCHDTTQQQQQQATTTSTTGSSSLAHEKSQHLPFTENAKEIARALRKLQQHNRKQVKKQASFSP